MSTGRRLADTRQGWFPLAIDEIQDGDYWKVLDPDTQEPVRSNARGNLTHTVWMFRGPNGTGFGTLSLHTVREEDDGTISVRPGDGSSNSILQGRGDKTWHGYIEHGVWTVA